MLRFLAPALALLLASPTPPTPPAPPAEPRPALWKLSDPDTTIYLFGTIHALPPGYRWTTPTLDKAIAASDELVIETLLDKDPDKAAALLYGLALTPGLPPIAERVDAADRTALADTAKRAHIPQAVLDGMETWAAALVLTQASLGALGLGAGVEDSLKTRFAGKSISGLETPEQQLGFLDALPEAEQRRFLAAVLEQGMEPDKEFAEMLAGWARGDEALIARSFDDEASVSPYLRDVLLTRRNKAWSAWLAARLRQPGTAFVAVGAGHLAGKGSVVELLRTSGLKVERVE
ncbi:TraB/GumN family protein [Sphingomonas jatrophae]|uniref:TraB family protein n=1 Tax=Sphingomonas jatrophae TaxID=1166337 RepID=A0A1I6JUG8_9SPHN|nr:TraB/GumN family protein [Sphingomonas jatrophae]SFR82596.1 hypothetical protein SAMN05192580_0894 [Sphingomonas jatrophae]